MNLQCNACGKRFRSMIAEAKHRHNFPILCSRNKRFAKFLEEIEKEKKPLTQSDDSAEQNPQA